MLVMEWSISEQEVAQSAFERAYHREISALTQVVQERASTIVALEDVWKLHDFLSARRHEIDGKYDYQYPVLMFVFANLIKDGWLGIEELEGLEKEKIAKIAALTRM